MGRIRIAVIGVGRMGLTHAENLSRRVRGAELVAVTTSDEGRAAGARQACGDIAVYPTVDDLLSAVALHILCEKPLALTVAGCDRAIAAVEAAGVTMMVGHVRQFDGGHAEAKRYIDSGAIGRPLVFRAISGDVDPPPASFADPAVSGGLIVDAMYHDVYLSRWLLDDQVIRAYAEGGALVDEAVGAVGDVDNAVVTLRYRGGAMGTFFVSRTTRYGHDLRVEVIGDEGAVQVGRFRQTPVRLLDRRGVHHDMPWTTPDRLGEAFVTELQAFVDCLAGAEGGNEPPVTGADSRETVAVTVAATQSMHRGMPMEL